MQKRRRWKYPFENLSQVSVSWVQPNNLLHKLQNIIYQKM